MKCFKIFIKQLKMHPLSITLFMIGYLIATLTLSINISNINDTNMQLYELNKGIEGNSIGVIFKFSKEIEIENFVEILDSIDNNSVFNINYSINTNGVDSYSVISHYFKENIKIKYPILEGQFYSIDNIKAQDKVVVVGKELKKLIEEENGDKTINIMGEKYTVLGIVGRSDRTTIWDNVLFIPLGCIPKNSSIYNKSFYNGTLISKEGSQAKDLENLNNRITILDKKACINESPIDDTYSLYCSMLNNNKDNFIKSILIVLFSMSTMIILSFFWINERQKEIAIKKVCGINNFQVSLSLFLEFLSITIISVIIALIIQISLGFFTNKIFNLFIRFTYRNILLGIILSITTAAVVSTISIIKAIKMQPIYILKK